MAGLPPDINRGPMMLRAIWIMDGIAAVIVGLRCFASLYIHRRLSWSDIFMILALGCGIGNNAIITVSESYGLGRHIFYLDPPNIVGAIKFQTIAEPVGILCPTFGRIAFAIYMLKLVGPQPLKRWMLHICIWSTVVVNLLTIILILVQCQHIQSIWDEEVPGWCWSKTVQSDFGYFQGAVNTLVDLVLTTLPAILVWNLQMNTRLKIGLAVLLGLSGFAAISSIVKTVELKSIGDGGDITYNLIPFIIWFTVENNVVIAAASIPTIRPLFVRRKSLHSNQYYGSSSAMKSGAATSNSRFGNSKAAGGANGSFALQSFTGNPKAKGYSNFDSGIETTVTPIPEDERFTNYGAYTRKTEAGAGGMNGSKGGYAGNGIMKDTQIVIETDRVNSVGNYSRRAPNEDSDKESLVKTPR